MSNQKSSELRNFTPNELKAFNGIEKTNPILMAVDGKVFDVSSSDLYSPGGSYNYLTGTDASRVLAKMEKTKETHIDDLNEEERKVLNDWVKKLSSKYPIVGQLVSSNHPIKSKL